MDFNGNDVTGFPSEVKFEDVCTTNLTATQINVGACGNTPLFTLPITAPPAGAPGSRVVMTALQAGEQVFRVPNVTFKWQIQDGAGTFHAVDVPIAAGDYSLEDDIFPVIEDQFQAVLAPLVASGDYSCSISGVTNKFVLTLANGVSIQQTVMFSAVLSDNAYLGSSGNSIIIGNSGSVSPLNTPIYTTITNPVMAWEPYSMSDTPAVTNPMDSNLDANNFAIKKLGYINLIKSGVPTPPINPEVTIFADIVGNLSIVDSAGIVQNLNAHRIIADDGTCSIFCNNGGVINYTAANNNFAPSALLTLPNQVSVPGPPNRYTQIAIGTKSFRLDNASPYLTFQDASGTRWQISSTNTDLWAPDLATGIQMTNGNLFVTNGASLQGAGTLIFQRLDSPNVMLIGDVNAIGLILGHVGITTTINGTFNTTNMDRVDAGALNIGAVNATAVNLGKVGFDTNIVGNMATSGTSLFQGNLTSNSITTLNEVRALNDPFNFLRNGLAVDVRAGQTGKTFDFAGRLTNNSNTVMAAQFVSLANGLVQNTTTETTLLGLLGGSATFLSTDFITGTTFGFELSGTCGTATAQLRLRLRGTVGGITGAVLIDTGNMSLATGDWQFTGSLTFRTLGAAGVAVVMSTANFRNSTAANGLVSQITNNTTAATNVNNVFNFTAQWTAANSSITQRVASMWRIF